MKIIIKLIDNEMFKYDSSFIIYLLLEKYNKYILN